MRDPERRLAALPGSQKISAVRQSTPIQSPQASIIIFHKLPFVLDFPGFEGLRSAFGHNTYSDAVRLR
jgi:hypothetical protein